MRLLPGRANQKGDTIIEVLIALAIISSVLAGAFLVTQKSAQAVRDGQERSEMLQILQGQVELVRSLAIKETSNNTGIFAAAKSNDICIDPTNTTNPTYIPATDTKCQTFQTLYSVSISYDSTSQIFTFLGTWDGITGVKNRELLTYRVYPS